MKPLGAWEPGELNPTRHDRCHTVVLSREGREETYKVSMVCLEILTSFIQMDISRHKEAQS